MTKLATRTKLQPDYPPEPPRPQPIQNPFGNGEPPRDPLQFMQEILQRQQKIDQQQQTSRIIRSSDGLESFGYIQFFLVMCGPGVDVGPTDPNCSFSLHRYDPGC